MSVIEGRLDADGNRHGEVRYYLAAPFKRGERVEAMAERAWYAWRSNRP
jgi:hypothetical protein